MKSSKAIFVANHVDTNLNMEYTSPNLPLDFATQFVQVKKKFYFKVSQSLAIEENKTYFCFLLSIYSCFKCSQFPCVDIQIQIYPVSKYLPHVAVFL
jgi:hypothetical protein